MSDTDAKLLGRGGAAFPTGRKWASVAKEPARPHYIVCNADESEPGTFKDRELMERDPFAVVEAMTIAAFATGSDKGFLYVRGEYPLARRRIENAIEQARAHGYLDFEIEVGAMEYGFPAQGILGLDFLLRAGALIDLDRLELHPARPGRPGSGR